jgi:16S rRNA (guanine966-N2)-methyltransferase
MGSVQIIAGRHRGRSLAAPPGGSVRPTSSRTREALFDILEHAAFAGPDLIGDARVLDAFAGTGALGLEALSRGAAHATFLERDRDARGLLAANIAHLGEEARSEIVVADALHPPRPTRPCTLVLMDPPYGDDVAAPALSAIAAQGWLATGAIVALELPAKPDFAVPEGFTRLDERRYGRARILFMRRD